ncbi:CLUMA_CG019973, isoform A [Clunio marinus]|uniref:beta-mannosidase n=1 Tax=Clunio marinus TaxID=568069 RepID=A0A1J1J4Y1_9DIPT|nr:CLUMA_CG019973, isoform A [Clunio marinus]
MRVIFLWLISLNLLLHGTQAISFPLRDGWTLTNENKSIEVNDISIPSGVYSDLENSGETESVLFSFNDVNLRWIALENWTYNLEFNMTEIDLEHHFVILTFNGIDTLAEIYLNGKLIGETNNMFIRYRFDVKQILIVGTNQLTVEFQSPVEGAKIIADSLENEIPPKCPPEMYHGECHVNLLRKMQASFAWDWGLAAPSMGLWKNVDLEFYDSILIRDVTYQLIEMNDLNEDAWMLKVFVHLETGTTASEFIGILAVDLTEFKESLVLNFTNVITDDNGEATVEVDMTVLKSSVKLWWPNGYGKQEMYTLRVRWEDERINEVAYFERNFLTSSKTVSIGFRTIEVVQEEMDNGGLSFYFKVNGIPIFMKGSNWIPSHILPEKSYDQGRIKELLSAARDANMNMLRVWGGGVYESDYFYSLADKYGILLWQDFMFACAMYPADEDFLESVRTEVKQNVRRIQYHPSIAIHATNNENEVALRQDWYGTNSRFSEFAQDYRTLYVNTITDEIKKHDLTREVLTSSPSNGDYNADRDKYGISLDPQDPHFGDIHFYIYDHNGWLAKNYHQPRFASEYGFQSFPSGWSEVIGKDDNLTELIDHRQHHPLKSKPISFLVEENLLVKFDSLSWDDKIYLSQLSQAMAIKTETEVYRAGRGSFMNTMGALFWQLNDVWVAPSWSSIEFNGNFKILHHWIKDIFAPQTLITQLGLLNKLNVFAVSDEINTDVKPMTVQMRIYKWNEFESILAESHPFNMTPNAVTLVTEIDVEKYFTDKGLNINENFVLYKLIDDTDKRLVASSPVFPGKFKTLKLIGDPKVKLQITTNRCENGEHRISLDVKIEKPALFISVKFVHDVIKRYRMSKNGFMQFEPIQVLQVNIKNPNCEYKFGVENFKVTTLNQFL